MEERDPLTAQIIGAAIEVHRVLGPGLLESIYEKCLMYELEQLGLSPRNQVELPVIYKGINMDASFFMDIVVSEQIVLELKTVETLLPIHEAQLLTYLRLSKIRRGLLLNFNVDLMKKGIKRLVL